MVQQLLRIILVTLYLGTPDDYPCGLEITCDTAELDALSLFGLDHELGEGLTQLHPLSSDPIADCPVANDVELNSVVP